MTDEDATVRPSAAEVKEAAEKRVSESWRQRLLSIMQEVERKKILKKEYEVSCCNFISFLTVYRKPLSISTGINLGQLFLI